MTFLQLGEMHTRRNVLDERQFAGMMKEERTHATTYTETEPEVDNNEAIYNMADAMVDVLTDMTVTAMASTPRPYPSRSCRSVVGHQPYGSYTP
jgi:hypothetical protein